MLILEEVKQRASPEELVRDYGALDKYHYPLRPISDEDIAAPEYDEIDERGFFQMARRVFDLNSYPGPPAPNSEETNQDQVRAACFLYNKLKEAYIDMYAGVRRISEFHTNYRPETVHRPADILNWVQRFCAEIGRAMGMPVQTDKGMMADHLDKKRAFWETGLAYLYSRRAESIESKSNEDDLFDEIECIQLMHMAYLAARSACHHLKPRRKNENLTIKHVYEVTIIEINFYLELLEKTTDPEKKREIYHLMKKAIIRSMLHDYLEDFAPPRGPLGSDFLRNKITSLITFDTFREILSKLPSNPGDRDPMDFWTEVKSEVMLEIAALSKPSEEERERMREVQKTDSTESIMEPHLRAQMIDGLPSKFALPTFFTKIADRLHNVRDLKDLDLKSQIKKLLQSRQMVQLGLDVMKNKRFANHILLPHLPGRLIILAEATIEEMKRVLEIEDISPEETSNLNQSIINLKQILSDLSQ